MTQEELHHLHRIQAITDAFNAMEAASALQGIVPPEQCKALLKELRSSAESILGVGNVYISKWHPDKSWKTKYDRSKQRKVEAASQLAELEKLEQENNDSNNRN